MDVFERIRSFQQYLTHQHIKSKCLHYGVLFAFDDTSSLVSSLREYERPTVVLNLAASAFLLFLFTLFTKRVLSYAKRSLGGVTG